MITDSAAFNRSERALECPSNDTLFESAVELEMNESYLFESPFIPDEAELQEIPIKPQSLNSQERNELTNTDLEDFESGPNEWIALGSNSSWQWGTPTDEKSSRM